MPILVKCPQCGRGFNIKEEMLGKQGKCTCGSAFILTAPPHPKPTPIRGGSVSETPSASLASSAATTNLYKSNQYGDLQVPKLSFGDFIFGELGFGILGCIPGLIIGLILCYVFSIGQLVMYTSATGERVEAVDGIVYCKQNGTVKAEYTLYMINGSGSYEITNIDAPDWLIIEPTWKIDKYYRYGRLRNTHPQLVAEITVSEEAPSDVDTTVVFHLQCPAHNRISFNIRTSDEPSCRISQRFLAFGIKGIQIGFLFGVFTGVVLYISDWVKQVRRSG